MTTIINTLPGTTEALILGVFSSILATIFVLLTRLIFYKFRGNRPSNKLFNFIKNSKEQCKVTLVRLYDKELKGEYVTRTPNYSAFSSPEAQYVSRNLIPFVISAEDSNAVSMVLNLLGKIGRTENIQISYIDNDWNNWEDPTFLIGGSWKTTRVFENFKPYYIIENHEFVIKETGDTFFQKHADDDLGLIEKVYNPNTQKPIWILIGMRGAGTAGAAYSLSKWWEIFAKLYGKKTFGFVVQFNDKDGWQNASIISYYPNPTCFKKLVHLKAYLKLKKLLKEY